MASYNYLEFLGEFDLVSIPKIQREYVQGQNERGEKFVEKIFEKLETGVSFEVFPDLVYGSKNNKIFKPVDGQQRLTTLYLLYWYIGKIELNSDAKANKLNKLVERLNKFTYETRESSRDFCKSLSNALKDREMITLKWNEIPSEKISSASWFYEKYKYDYTVKSMLSMLDLIQENYVRAVKKIKLVKGKKIVGKVRRNPHLYDCLSKMSFNVLEMSEFNLGDELYVIMNDRGKRLTPFENFKSSFLGWINNKYPEYLDGESENKNSPYLELAMKFDNEWIERLWERMERDNDKTDAVMYQFFIRYVWALYALAIDKSNEEKDRCSILRDANVAVEKKVRDEKIINPMAKKEIDFDNYFRKALEYITRADNEEEHKKNVKYLYDNMTTYLNYLLPPDSDKDGHENCINNFLAAPWRKNSKQLKSILTTDEFENEAKVCNYALMLYIEKYKNNISETDSNWKDWKRFVWNIIEETKAVDSADNALRAIKIIGDNKDGIGDIISFLKNKDESELKTSAEKFEIRKAKYIKHIRNVKKDENWEKKFYEAEQHPYLKGYVDFLLPDDLESDTDEKFNKRYENTKFIFPEDEEGFNKNDDRLIIRALISKIEQTQLENDSKNKGKKEEQDTGIMIADQETDRGKLKTAIKSSCLNKIIKEYICGADNIEKLQENMKKSCKDKYEETPDDEWLYWRNELSNNIDLINWIQGIAEKNKGVYLYANRNITIHCNKYNTSGKQIRLKKEFAIWQTIEDKGFVPYLGKEEPSQKAFCYTKGKEYKVYLGDSTTKFRHSEQNCELVVHFSKEKKTIAFIINGKEKASHTVDSQNAPNVQVNALNTWLENNLEKK